MTNKTYKGVRTAVRKGSVNASTSFSLEWFLEAYFQPVTSEFLVTIKKIYVNLTNITDTTYLKDRSFLSTGVPYVFGGRLMMFSVRNLYAPDPGYVDLQLNSASSISDVLTQVGKIEHNFDLNTMYDVNIPIRMNYGDNITFRVDARNYIVAPQSFTCSVYIEFEVENLVF